MKSILTIVSVVIIFIFISGLIDNTPSNTADRDANSKESKAMANIMAQEFVSKRLKSPSTASFNKNPTVTLIGGKTYSVNSYVDSQNSFGAVIRMNFIATVQFMYVSGDQEKWNLISLVEL